MLARARAGCPSGAAPGAVVGLDGVIVEREVGIANGANRLAIVGLLGVSQAVPSRRLGHDIRNTAP